MTVRFGCALRMMRALHDLPQRELARTVQVDQAIIAKLESGTILPSADLESRIRIALRWPPRADEAFALLEEEAVTEVVRG